MRPRRPCHAFRAPRTRAPAEAVRCEAARRASWRAVGAAAVAGLLGSSCGAAPYAQGVGTRPEAAVGPGEAAGSWQLIRDAARCPFAVPTLASPAPSPGRVPEPAWDLRCIELLPTAAGGGASGVVDISRRPSPFAVTVTPEGRHVRELAVRVRGLPDPASLGPYSAYVAWATPIEMDPVRSLGEVGNDRVARGSVDFAKYLVLVTAEPSAAVTERSGPIVLRGRSPSTRMQSHDLLATAPAAEMGAAGAHDARDGHGRDAEAHAHDAQAHDGHDGDAEAAARDGAAWRLPPPYPRVPMLAGIMTLRPDVGPLALARNAGSPPDALPRSVVRLPDGGTLDLEAGVVRRTIAGRTLEMLAFNGQQPGPLVEVAANTTIFVNFTNATPFPTAVHWHGVRLDNRFDGVPGVTQDPVPPGGSFRYTVRFPDAGIYWYHPHHREDVQQELGLAGNLLVRPQDPAAYGPANREEVLLLDDILLSDGGAVPFGEEAATHALMGRFGNVALVNGEPDYALEVPSGSVVRFYFTNASNTRTWNLSFAPEAEGSGAAAGGSAGALPIKVVATDVGRFEREELVESVVIAPAERYVVDVRFPKAGRWTLANRVLGINHRQGVFLAEETPLGSVIVGDAPAAPDLARSFAELRSNADVIADIDRYRARFDDPPDREIVLALETDALPEPVLQSMRYDWVYFHPVEWTGTMPVMNWATTARRVRWTIREPASGRSDMEISWRFRVGDVVRVRIHNDRASVHAMQHPFHIHGQRFLVLAQDGVRNPNLAWKDTVLLPAGSVTDILLELSNPGRWMAHCHIAEHLEAGMKMVFDVEG